MLQEASALLLVTAEAPVLAKTLVRQSLRHGEGQSIVTKWDSLQGYILGVTFGNGPCHPLIKKLQKKDCMTIS